MPAGDDPPFAPFQPDPGTDPATAARLVSVLLITEDHDLEGYRRRCIGRDSDLATEKLRKARELLAAIATTLIEGGEERWQKLESARELVCNGGPGPDLATDPPPFARPSTPSPPAPLPSAPMAMPSAPPSSRPPPSPPPSSRPPFATAPQAPLPPPPPRVPTAAPAAPLWTTPPRVEPPEGTPTPFPPETVAPVTQAPRTSPSGDEARSPSIVPPAPAGGRGADRFETTMVGALDSLLENQGTPFLVQGPTPGEEGGRRPTSGSLDALPFRMTEGPDEPPPSARPVPAWESVERTLDGAAGLVPPVKPVPELTLEEYAWLSTNRQAHPGQPVGSEHGLTDEASWLALENAWQQRFRNEDDLRRRYEELLAHYRQFVQQQ